MSLNYPIGIVRTFFVKSIVVSIPGYQQTLEPTSPNTLNDLQVAPLEGKPGEYLATFVTKVNSESSVMSPYLIDMECIGHFVADSTVTPEMAHRAVTIIANNVLYGAVREAVAWLTSRQANGQLMLGLSILQPTESEDSKKTTEKSSS